MGVGTKNRHSQTADLCREHLRQAYASQRGLVEDFILEIEGSGKSRDILQWGQFTNMDRDPALMLGRLGEKFNRWLSGEV